MMSVSVFVFGSNLQGFHGAGSAGFAFRGESANTWRSDSSFLSALRAPVGSPLRVGKLAVFGIARGLQHGHSGYSYGIVTCTKPGARRSVPIESILLEIISLLKFAASHPNFHFECSPIGCGYSGYSTSEMADCWATAIRLAGGCPRNCSAPNYSFKIPCSQT